VSHDPVDEENTRRALGFVDGDADAAEEEENREQEEGHLEENDDEEEEEDDDDDDEEEKEDLPYNANGIVKPPPGLGFNEPEQAERRLSKRESIVPESLRYQARDDRFASHTTDSESDKSAKVSSHHVLGREEVEDEEEGSSSSGYDRKPVDFESEELVNDFELVEWARMALARREEVLTMFRADEATMKRYARAGFGYLVHPCYAYTLFCLPCWVRGVMFQEELGKNVYYVISDQGCGTVVRDIGDDWLALPRAKEFHNKFIHWDQVLEIVPARTTAGVCRELTAVAITFTEDRRRRRSKKSPDEEYLDGLVEFWYVSNPYDVALALRSFYEKKRPHSLASSSASGPTLETKQSLDSLRSLKGFLDSMFPGDKNDGRPKRVFVQLENDPNSGEVIMLEPEWSWDEFMDGVADALNVELGPKSRLFLRKGSLNVGLKSKESVLEDDRVILRL